jgi:hypothetical protein
MFDFVMVFGVDAFCYDTTQKTPNDNVEKVEPANESTFFGKYRSLVDFLRQYLFSNQYTLRSIAVEGFARLCFTNTIVDSKVSIVHISLYQYLSLCCCVWAFVCDLKLIRFECLDSSRPYASFLH